MSGKQGVRWERHTHTHAEMLCPIARTYIRRHTDTEMYSCRVVACKCIAGMGTPTHAFYSFRVRQSAAGVAGLRSIDSAVGGTRLSDK